MRRKNYLVRSGEMNLVKQLIGPLTTFVLSLITFFIFELDISFRIIIILVFFLISLILFIYILHKGKTLEKKKSASRNTTGMVFPVDGIRYNIKKAIKEAKHSVFVSGATLSSLCVHRDLLSNLPSKIKLDLVLLNNDNKDLLKDFCSMVGGPDKPSELETQYKNFLIVAKHLKDRENTFIKYVDFIMPISYVAIDIDKIESTTKIKSHHYTKSIRGDEGSIGFVVKPKTRLFKIYEKQIRNLCDNAQDLVLDSIK